MSGSGISNFCNGDDRCPCRLQAHLPQTHTRIHAYIHTYTHARTHTHPPTHQLPPTPHTRYYNDAFIQSGHRDSYPGINAATVAFLLHETDTAHELANDVAGSCASARACVCTSVRVGEYVCINVFIFMCIYIYLYMFLCMFEFCAHTYICMYTHVCMRVCMYVAT